jgi:hypothetical protein
VTILTKNHDQLTAEVARHIAADSVKQGSYRTCFIGCLAHQQDDPQYIQDTYGIPVMLTRILEGIFENLSAGKAVEFFAALPVAVGHDGKDLTKVSWKFLVWVLKKVPQQPQEIQAVIDPVITGLSLLAEGKEWNKDDARASTYYVAALAGASAARVAVAARAADAGVSVEWQRDLILRLIEEA